MKTEVFTIIKQEVKKHEYEMDQHHIDTVSKLLYEHLIEIIPEEALSEIIDEMKEEFLGIVDLLIPIIEEYESKVSEVLEQHLGGIINKI